MWSYPRRELFRPTLTIFEMTDLMEVTCTIVVSGTTTHAPDTKPRPPRFSRLYSMAEVERYWPSNSPNLRHSDTLPF
jgi:hypothetical protein